MTTTARPGRRERLKLVVSEQAETEAIERILRKRLRERRERVGAKARRQAESEKLAPWVDPKELAGNGNPYDLETALKSGRVRWRFQHRARWWVWKDPSQELWKAIKAGMQLIGTDGASRVDNEQWVLRINEADWREYLSAPATRSENETSPRRATPQQIIAALQAVYDEADAAGRKAPNVKEAPPLAQARLKTQGFYASQNQIAGYSDQFSGRRGEVGKTLKGQKVST